MMPRKQIEMKWRQNKMLKNWLKFLGKLSNILPSLSLQVIYCDYIIIYHTYETLIMKYLKKGFQLVFLQNANCHTLSHSDVKQERDQEKEAQGSDFQAEYSLQNI